MGVRQRHRPWTADDDARLLSYGDTMTSAQAAVALGRSRPAVLTRYDYLRAGGDHADSTRRNWTAADDRELARLHRLRVAGATIAARLRRSPGSVRSRLHVLGLSHRAPREG